MLRSFARDHTMSTTPAGCGTAGASTLFEAKGLAFAYPHLDLLDDLSFSIDPGLTLVRGGDGRGKSTLLRLIAGALAPRSGVIHRRAETLCYECPADPANDADIARAWMGARRSRFPGWQADVEIGLIEGFGLAEHVDKPMYMLSTGTRRKVGLVTAAASGAQLTLIDNPFAALDARSCTLLIQLLTGAAASRSRAWVIADHELPSGLAGVSLSGLVDLDHRDGTPG